MSFSDVQDIGLFSVFGFTLNIEERSILSKSLLLKKEQEKLENIKLFGKVLGVNADYLIAQSYSSENYFHAKYFYSIDNVNWLQLPDVTPTDVKKAEAIQARFSGDPGYEFTVSKYVTGLDDNDDRKLKEEKRLAATIALINYDAQVVPRGAFYRDSNDKLHYNAGFEGLKNEEVGDLSNYFHFREGFQISTKTLTERVEKFDESIDIFESVVADEPKGVWSLQTEEGGSVAVLRSLLWPGYSFVHTPYNGKSASFYYGTGQKNINAGYML